MTYTALARKWRPRTFSQLLGQDTIKKMLVNSLEQNRLHHAYLFTGTRGVGKTSVARLFAKSLNCEQGISAQPCLQCIHCLSIEQGQSLDVVEVDGASKTRVEDTRELLENIQYVPTLSRFKIYLIDEVHMLSNHSFNALLKTLEEPPEHIKFLLATTDPQKLPVTVLSRCLQFNLKPLSIETIGQHLQTILSQENIQYETSALELIAKAAQGSLRDALSLLDQAIISCDGFLKQNEIKSLLGYSQQDYALQILHALANLDPISLINISDKINQEGGPYKYVLEELIHYFHQLSILQNVPHHQTLMHSEAISTFVDLFSPEDVQLFYQIAMQSQNDLQLAPTPMIAFNMILLRMYTFRPKPYIDPPKQDSEQEKLKEDLGEPTVMTATETITTTASLDSRIGHIQASQDKTIISWEALLAEIKLSGLALTAAENADLIQKENGVVTLEVLKGHHSLFTPSVIKRIEEGLSQYYDEPIKLKINLAKTVNSTPALEKQTAIAKANQQAEEALRNDPAFQALHQEFSAEIVKNSITSLEDSL